MNSSTLLLHYKNIQTGLASSNSPGIIKPVNQENVYMTLNFCSSSVTPEHFPMCVGLFSL